MPELHKNQIQWAAPEAQMVTLAKPDYSDLAEGAQALGNAAKEFADYQKRIDDIDAKERLDQASDAGLAELEKHEPSDNNYEEALNNYYSGLDSVFNSFDDATRVRFQRDYPKYFEAQKLKADAIVFDKQQKYMITKAEKLVPLLASNVTEGKVPYQQSRAELELMLEKVDNVTAERMLFNFDNFVQVGNLQNLIAGREFAAALKVLDNPKESDTFTPEYRTRMKIAIQDTMERYAKEAATLKKQIKQDMDSALEAQLTNSLVYALDEKGNNYARLLQILDDKNAEIELKDDYGEVVGKIKVGDINPNIRRKAMKAASAYEADSMSWSTNSVAAKELAENLQYQYNYDYGKRNRNEKFNQIYDFTQSADFYYLKPEDRKKMWDIVNGQVALTNSLVVPYSDVRNQRYLYGVGREYSAPSPQQIISDYVFGNGKPEVKKNEKRTPVDYISSLSFPMMSGTISLRPVSSAAPDFENKQRGYRQVTDALREDYEKQTNNEVLYGSTVEFLMNLYSQILVSNADERKTYGIDNATNEQIGLTYNRILGNLQASGQDTVIIGQDMSSKQADETRKAIFDSFFKMLHNGSDDIDYGLTKEQIEVKKKMLNAVTEGSYGTGGAPMSFTPTEYTVRQGDKLNISSESIRKQQETQRKNILGGK